MAPMAVSYSDFFIREYTLLSLSRSLVISFLSNRWHCWHLGLFALARWRFLHHYHETTYHELHSTCYYFLRLSWRHFQIGSQIILFLLQYWRQLKPYHNGQYRVTCLSVCLHVTMLLNFLRALWAINCCCISYKDQSISKSWEQSTLNQTIHIVAKPLWIVFVQSLFPSKNMYITLSEKIKKPTQIPYPRFSLYAWWQGRVVHPLCI